MSLSGCITWKCQYLAIFFFFFFLHFCLSEMTHVAQVNTGYCIVMITPTPATYNPREYATVCTTDIQLKEQSTNIPILVGHLKTIIFAWISCVRVCVCISIRQIQLCSDTNSTWLTTNSFSMMISGQWKVLEWHTTYRCCALGVATSIFYDLCYCPELFPEAPRPAPLKPAAGWSPERS